LIDPLLSPVFIVAAILNLVPVLIPGIQWSVPIRAIPRGLNGLWSLVAVFAHVAFIIRVRRCVAFAARQRDVELDWFSTHPIQSIGVNNPTSSSEPRQASSVRDRD
jgi:hypothetical protein